nr:DUF4785 domain-containing protein [Legionella quateirensis]
MCSQLSHENLQDKWSISNEPLNRTINNSQKSYGYKEASAGTASCWS